MSIRGEVAIAHPRRFRFGVQPDTAAGRDEWAAKARTAESLGFSSFLMPDHIASPVFAAMPALTAAAAATSTLRLGTLVADNDLRHPVLLAKEAATVDVLSGGRLELGLGAGWLRTDYEESGIAFDAPAVRVDRLEESIAIIKGLFSDGPFSFEGKHYTVAGLDGQPKPAQRPHPPIVVGGGGRRMLSIAAREADVVALNPNLRAGTFGSQAGQDATAAATARKVDWVRDAAGPRFAELELAAVVFSAVRTDDRKTVAENVGSVLGLSAEETLQAPHALVGTTEEMTEDLERRRDEYGISYVVVQEFAMDAIAPVVARLAGT